VLAANRVKEGAFYYGMVKAHWAKATRAVTNTTAHLGDRLVEQRAHAAEALADRREALSDTVADRRDALHDPMVERRELITERAHALEDTLAERRRALEGFVHSSLESAEELSRASRLRQRELGVDGV